MRTKSNMIKGIIVLVAVVTVFLLLPAAASATIYPFSRFYGQVYLEGQNVPAGTTVSAWIDNADGSPWTTTVTMQGNTANYILDVPASSGGAVKDGGVNGDVVRFSARVNGIDYNDVGTAVFESAANVFHLVLLSGAGVPLSITTSALPDGEMGSPYSFTVMANGGVGAYNWSATGLPANLTINAATGEINGTPASAGNSAVVVTVSDTTDSVDKPFNLFVADIGGVLLITTTALDRSPVEVFPAVPPPAWGVLPVPGWLKNQPYTSTLACSGGVGTITWDATNLPPGLVISADGVVSGTPTTEGEYVITFTVMDSASVDPPVTKDLSLKIYKVGDANGNNQVTVADVTYVERVILGLAAPTAGCDANISNGISIADVTKVERIILGLP